MRNKVRKLWELCFNDSKAFVDMYFRLRYSNNVNIAIESGEEVIAALQMLPYPMTFCNTTISTSYVSGACTHPDFRNRGVMRELLTQTFGKMYRNEVQFSTLIPAEPWLFDYYTKMGYKTVFNYELQTIKTPVTAHIPEGEDLYELESSTAYKEDVYQYLNRKLQERACCIQHTATDFNVILEDLKLGKGNIYFLRQKTQSNGNGNTIAIAVAYPHENDSTILHIGELIAESEEIKTILLSYIARKERIKTFQLIIPSTTEKNALPLGMARIIQAKAVLQIYAARYPKRELNIALTDEQISSNNGYYYLNNGKCMFSSQRLPGVHKQFNISELTGFVLSDEHPYMSLMLN